MRMDTMAKKMLIDATHAEETRVVVVDGNKVEEFDFESENKRQLAGNIYLAKVTRVEPSLQAAFVDYGGNRHGFLAFSEIHPDYYQIPIADREALMEEERAFAEAQKARDEEDEKRKTTRRRRRPAQAEKVDAEDAVVSGEDISGMETIDLGDEGEGEGTPVPEIAAAEAETPQADAQPESAGDDTPNADGEDGLHTEDSDGDDDEVQVRDASALDDDIESVAEEDDQEDIRPIRKPRPRRYKIQEVVKVRQILLVQVVKEERGNKGAALTTYLSLAGRYCVLMPNTARGGGISRKITNAVDRKKLKETASEIDVPKGAGLIVRTAGAKRTKTEIKRDYEYLQRMWEQIRELTLKSIAPASIYEEGDLIKRSIRDLYSRDIDEVLVEGERGYRNAKDFMKMIMPSHAKNVKHYSESMPLFARYQVETYLGGMFNPTVQLKSGGYIVIGVTEALVAIDVNSGRATKEGSIEDTATKTNLEAAEEVARQLRLRDLAGLIVIDFIDMDERKNNLAVEKKLKDKLKTDRARIQIGRISGFGLLEMSRQRLRPGMLEATTQPCPSCHGTGLIRSDDSMALNILRQIEEEGVRRRSREVLIKCPVGIANYLMNQKREHVAAVEARYGLSVRIEGDPHLVSPDFTLEKFKTATRVVPEPSAAVSVSSMLMDQDDEQTEDVVEDEEEADVADTPEPVETAESDDDQKPKKRRRRRRRRRGGNGGENDDNGSDASGESGSDDVQAPVTAEGGSDADADAGQTPAEAEGEGGEPAEKPKRKSRSRSRSRKKTEEPKVEETQSEPVASDAGGEDTPNAGSEPDPLPNVQPESPAEAQAEMVAADPAVMPEVEPVEATAAPIETGETAAVDEPAQAAEAEKPAKAPARRTRARKPAVVAAQSDPAPEPAVAEGTTSEANPDTASEAASDIPAEAPGEAAAQPAEVPAEASAQPAEEESKPKRRGWWSLSKG